LSIKFRSAGVKAVTLSCPTTTSMAKNTPAIGALNEAASAEAALAAEQRPLQPRRQAKRFAEP
jgi:hypothetical protein